VPLLGRANKITQHRLNRSERLKSAEHAFTLASDTSINAPVLLIDDIITTGATISQAALTLHDRYDTIFVGALAYQPLD
jgi:predicted amidophosphoribosyltransferase